MAAASSAGNLSASSAGNLAAARGEIATKPAIREREIAAKSLSAILRETSRSLSRSVLWILEAFAMIALGFCLALLPLVHEEAARCAVSIAAGYFLLSASLGGYLLLIGKNRAGRAA